MSNIRERNRVMIPLRHAILALASFRHEGLGGWCGGAQEMGEVLTALRLVGGMRGLNDVSRGEGKDGQ